MTAILSLIGILLGLALLIFLAVSNCKHKESYLDICVTACIIPVIVSLLLSFVWGLFL